jgi:flagellum-specific peptidoglycan hydrolase FlgJ
MFTTNSFIEYFSNRIHEAVSGTGLFASVMMAQAILESGWGNDVLPQKYNNYFGIKADARWKAKHPGKACTLKTPRDTAFGGTAVSEFRVYDDPMDSIRDRIQFLTENKRYHRHGVFTASSPDEQAEALERAGYAGTKKDYNETLVKVIDKHGLRALDV